MYIIVGAYQQHQFCTSLQIVEEAHSR